MLSTTPSSSLPSLYGACEPNPDPNARGFAALPVGRWWWDSALSEQEGVWRTRFLRGKVLLLVDEVMALAAPLCRRALDVADAGAAGPDAQALTRYLETEGPSVLATIKRDLNLDSKTLARIRRTLEPVGAVISEEVELPAKNGGHIHTSRLRRYDDIDGIPTSDGSGDDALSALLLTGVGAAVVAPSQEVASWFTWPGGADALARLIDRGELVETAPGWVHVGPQ